MKYIIDRTKWLRGEGSMRSFLLRADDGKMCCLGQVGEQCGLSSADMLSIQTPWALESAALARYPEWLNRPVSGDRVAAMTVNDNEKLSDAEREAKLTALFAKHGDELEFIN